MIVAAVAVLGAWWWLGREPSNAEPKPTVDMSLVEAPRKPSSPPQVGQPRRQVPMPEMPEVDREALRAAYEQAEAQGTPPGQAAFRKMISAFMAYNAEFAQAKAAKEGLSVAEIEELTYFGYMVMATQQVSEVEDLIGRTLTEAERQRLGDLQATHNNAFSEAMEHLVAERRPESDRWQLIRDSEAAYLADLYAVTGLDDETFDALLAGDLMRTGAPAAAEYPEVIEPQPYVPDRERPTEAPAIE